MKNRVLISSIPPSEGGGVISLLNFTIDTLIGAGYEVGVAYYRSSNQKGRCTIPFSSWLNYKPKIKEYTDSRGVSFYELNAKLPEIECLHYYPNLLWRKLIEQYDYYGVVAGNVLAAYPFAKLNLPFFNWLATPFFEDRVDRVRSFSWYRRCFDKMINVPSGLFLEKKLLKKGKLLPTSHYSAHRFQAIQPKANIKHVLPMPIDTAIFKPDLKRVRPWRIGFLGRLNDPRKNIALSFYVLKALLVNHPEAELVLLGEKPGKKDMALIKQLGLAEKVTLISHLSQADLVRELQALDVFFIPSHQEGLCIAGMEAMACGCVVVSTPCGGPEEFIVQGKNSFIVSFSPEEIAKVIERICADRARRDELSQNAIATISQHYSCQEAAKKILSALR